MTDSAAAEVVICSVCGVVPPGHRGRRPICNRCQAGRLMDRALDAGNGATSPALLPLADTLRATKPETVLRWLSRPQPRALLAEFATGRMPLTHHALHEYPHRNVAEHLRHRLVACGILPTVDAQLRPATTRSPSTSTRHRRRPWRSPHHDHAPGRQRRHDLEPLRPLGVSTVGIEPHARTLPSAEAESDVLSGLGVARAVVAAAQQAERAIRISARPRPFRRSPRW